MRRFQIAFPHCGVLAKRRARYSNAILTSAYWSRWRNIYLKSMTAENGHHDVKRVAILILNTK